MTILRAFTVGERMAVPAFEYYCQGSAFKCMFFFKPISQFHKSSSISEYQWARTRCSPVSNIGAKPPLGHLLLKTQKLLSASLTSNSQAVYANALPAFTAFLYCYSFPDMWPSHIEHIILFVAYSFDLGYSPSTIATYISGISFYHKFYNLDAPTALTIIKKLLEGCKIIRPRQDVRAPIIEPILEQIYLPNICMKANFLRPSIWQLTLILLCISELVFTKQTQANRSLLSSDVQVVDNSQARTVSIRFSKTNQSGAPTVLRIPASSSSLCCIKLVERYQNLRPSDSRYFFSHVDGTPLTRSQLSSILTKAIRILGCPSQLYTSHSFHIGRANDLVVMGVQNDTIKKLGRWPTDSVEEYIRLWNA